MAKDKKEFSPIDWDKPGMERFTDDFMQGAAVFNANAHPRTNLMVKITGDDGTLDGEEGNAYAIMAKVRQVLTDRGLGIAVAQFLKEAQSGDYEHLLEVVHDWVEVQ